MQFTPEQIAEFKRIHREQYGEELTDEEAYEAAQNLVGFMQLLFEIHRKNKGKL